MKKTCMYIMENYSTAPEKFVQGRPKVHNPFCKLQKNNKQMAITIAMEAKKFYKTGHFPANGECHFHKNKQYEKCPYFKQLETET